MFLEDDDSLWHKLISKICKNITTCYTIMTSDDFLRISQMKGEKISEDNSEIEVEFILMQDIELCNYKVW